MNKTTLCAATLCAFSIAANCLAGQALGDGKTDGKKIIHEPLAPEPAWQINFRTSYTFESDFSRGQHHPNGDSFYKQVDINHRFPLAGVGLPGLSGDGGWYMRVGASYARWDFGNSGGLPIPNHLQGVNAKIALEYLVKGRTGFLLETEPGFYFEDDIEGNNFDSPTKLALAYPLSDRFTIVGGVSYAGLRSYQFIPIVGFVWQINDRLMVNMLPPEPRVIYSPTDKLSLWAGGELAGGSFRVDERKTREKKSLNNAVLDYSEWRAGAGFIYHAGPCNIEVGGGYAFQRKFDYHRAEEGFETDEGAPYLKLVVSGAF